MELTGIEMASGKAVINAPKYINAPRKYIGKEPCCENCKYYAAKWGTYKCMSSGNVEGGMIPTDRWCKDFWPRPKEEE